MSSRRSFLRLMGLSPIAAKAAADKAIADLSGTNLSGMAFTPPEYGNTGWQSLSSGAKASGPFDAGIETHAGRSKLLRLACKIPKLAQEFEAELYEKHRYVGSLDTDIAIKQSFSLAAKITFQRQRNVERNRESLCSEEGSSWETQDEFVKKLARRAREWMWTGG